MNCGQSTAVFTATVSIGFFIYISDHSVEAIHFYFSAAEFFAAILMVAWLCACDCVLLYAQRTCTIYNTNCSNVWSLLMCMYVSWCAMINANLCLPMLGSYVIVSMWLVLCWHRIVCRCTLHIRLYFHYHVNVNNAYFAFISHITPIHTNIIFCTSIKIIISSAKNSKIARQK